MFLQNTPKIGTSCKVGARHVIKSRPLFQRGYKVKRARQGFSSFITAVLFKLPMQDYFACRKIWDDFFSLHLRMTMRNCKKVAALAALFYNCSRNTWYFSSVLSIVSECFKPNVVWDVILVTRNQTFSDLEHFNRTRQTKALLFLWIGKE